MMSSSFRPWFYMNRIVSLSGTLGALLGAIISTWNADQFGWSLIRVVVLGGVFAWCTKIVVRKFSIMWATTRMEVISKRLAEKKVKSKAIEEKLTHQSFIPKRHFRLNTNARVDVQMEKDETKKNGV
jgi:hypothetical protein